MYVSIIQALARVNMTGGIFINMNAIHCRYVLCRDCNELIGDTGALWCVGIPEK